MTAIPSGTKFVGIGASVPTPENKSSQNNAFQEVYTIDDLKDSVFDLGGTPSNGDVITYSETGPEWRAPEGGGTATTITVNISSAQILAIGDTPIELLPAPGANKYYDIEKILLEFSIGTTPYTFEALDALRILGYGVLSATSISSAPFDMVFNPNGSEISAGDIAVGQFNFINFPVNLTVVSEVNPTLGDGTLRAIITYTVRTFGA